MIEFRIQSSKEVFDGRANVSSTGQPKLTALFNDAAGHFGSRIVAIYAILFAFNIGAWIWASVAFHRYRA